MEAVALLNEPGIISLQIIGDFVEKPFDKGPVGARNIGEPALVAADLSILNAITHATGRRICQLPANLERVRLSTPC